MSQKDKQDIFTRFTSSVSTVLGHAWIFITALVVLILWGCSGPFLGFSDTWQLIINTSTTIITFLMVFIIQNTQNRDNLAINIKLDTLMKKMDISADDVINAEEKSDKKLETQKKQIAEQAEHSNSTKKQKRTSK